jgi:hypothetical protein
MKKLTYLLLAVGVILIASCQKPSEKSAGTYNGTYTVLSSNYSGSDVITASGDNTNWEMHIPSMSVNGTANGVTTSASGDNVTFSFTSSSTTDGDITAISGTLTGNNLTFSFTVRVSGSGVTGTFSGSK